MTANEVLEVLDRSLNFITELIKPTPMLSSNKANFKSRRFGSVRWQRRDLLSAHFV